MYHNQLLSHHQDSSTRMILRMSLMRDNYVICFFSKVRQFAILFCCRVQAHQSSCPERISLIQHTAFYLRYCLSLSFFFLQQQASLYICECVNISYMVQFSLLLVFHLVQNPLKSYVYPPIMQPLRHTVLWRAVKIKWQFLQERGPTIERLPYHPLLLLFSGGLLCLNHSKKKKYILLAPPSPP